MLTALTRPLVLSVLLCSTLVGCGGSGSAPARVTNYDSEGNLKISHKIGCAPSAEIRNTFTAADLYSGIPECIRKKDFEAGAFLFAIAGAYGRFDALRVSDTSARQAATVLRMTYVDSLDEKDRDMLLGQVTAMLGNPEKLGATCARIREIGAPNYHPSYMIQHGMGAFLGGSTKSGLIDGFDSKATWEQALTGYLHCPEAKQTP